MAATMSNKKDDKDPASQDRAAASRRPLGRRVLRGIGWSLATLLLAVALLLAGLWWWMGSSQSLAFVLTQVARYMPAGQTLESSEVTGSLRAGGRIGALRWQSDTLAVEVKDATIGWQLSALWQRRQLKLGEVHAALIAIEPRGPKEKDEKPLEPLEQLVLPLNIELPFRVDTLRWAGPPVVEATGLAGSYRYQDGQHQLDVQGVDLADGHYGAKVALQGAAPMALEARVDGRVRAPMGQDRNIDVLAWVSAKGTLSGAEARLDVQAELAPADNSAEAPMQAQLRAAIAPWQSQPVLSADAQLRNVDLARLLPEAPVTQLTGEVHAGPDSAVGALAWQGSVDLRNGVPGPWDEGKLPIEKVQARALFDGHAWTLPQAEVHAGGGRIEASGNWRPAPEPWKARADVRGVRPGELHTQLAGAPINGQLSAEQREGGRIDFALDLKAQGGAGAAAARDSLEGLRIDRVTARGQWQEPLLILQSLRVQAAGAELEGQLRARPVEQSGEGRLQLKLPGAQAQLQADMAPAKGKGQLKTQLADIAALQQWIERLPGLEKVFGGMALQGNATLDAHWTGGWQTLQQRLAAPEIPAARGSAEPTLKASLGVPRLALRQKKNGNGGGNGEPDWQLRGLRAELDGSLARARLELDGEALSAQQQITLKLQGSGGLERARQWRAEIASLRAQLRPNTSKPPAPWSLELQRPLAATIRSSSNASALQVDGSGGAATLTGPAPGTVRVDWEPTRFSQSGPPDKRAVRLQSKGRLQGLPLAWAQALGPGTLRDMGVSGDLVFEGDWDVDASDQLRAKVRLARASGDIRVQAGEAAMVRKLRSTGTGTASEITTDAGADGRDAPSTPAGLRQAVLQVDAEGQQLRASLVWDSERAGRVLAEASTQLAQAAGGWSWPEDAPLAGNVQASLPQLGVWSVLAPPGWRIGGTLDAKVALSGSRKAPRWNGQLAADQLSLRAAVEGIDLKDGRLRASLAGNRLALQEFTLKGGPGSKVRIPGRSGNLSTRASETGSDGGSFSLRGDASWGEAAPAGTSGIRMDMRGEVRSLRVLVRSDRQVTLSGDLQARLDEGQIQLRGKLRTDRGVIILPAETAPSLGPDVMVQSKAKARAEAQAAAKRREQEESEEQKVTQPSTAKPLDVRLSLDLGDDFAVQGHGITTRLAGELEISASGAGNPPRVTGEVRTVRGVYRAYGQQLDVETGIARFNGPAENPQLDVLAIRPNITQRAGVQISGTANAPRVKLYSEPPLSDAETLSWVMLGRASAANGGEAILMQQAALALLGKLGADSSGGNLASRFGLDEIGFKGASSNGEVQDSAVTLGKRLSKDFYVTYERSLAGTLGTFYIFYDLTQRLTLRGQAGEHYGADLIYTIKYD